MSEPHAPGQPVPRPAASVRAFLKQGDLIGAYDRAREALEAGADEPELRYLSVLALARAGATARAALSYRRLRLHRLGPTEGALAVDVWALWGRIRKDAAIALPESPARTRGLARAARAYGRAHRLSGGDYFPGINAATLSALAGATEAATALARTLLDGSDLAEPRSYWAGASRGEALLLLGRPDEAAAAFRLARTFPHAAADVASTRRQLRLLLGLSPLGEALAARLLAELHLPVVMHLVGSELPSGADDPALTRAIDAAIDTERPQLAVGSPWSSGALLVAERLLERGVELHLVLPFGEADYLAWFRDRVSPAELARRERCLKGAASLLCVTADGDFPDPHLVAFAEQVSSGLATLRARWLATECVDILIGRDAAADAPETGRRRLVLASSLAVRSCDLVAAADPLRPASLLATGEEREIRTLLFADVVGFSRLPESRMPDFWSVFMRRVGTVVNQAGSAVLHRNTWGDALFLVVADAVSAARLALRLQEEAAALARETSGGLAMRIGLHHGPVFRGHDPIRGTVGYFGTQVSRAARVEPVVPPGAVYVTEPFAALLAGSGAPGFEAEYVGVVALAKRYGEHRLYHLTRRASPD